MSDAKILTPEEQKKFCINLLKSPVGKNVIDYFFDNIEDSRIYGSVYKVSNMSFVLNMETSDKQKSHAIAQVKKRLHEGDIFHKGQFSIEDIMVPIVQDGLWLKSHKYPHIHYSDYQNAHNCDMESIMIS